MISTKISYLKSLRKTMLFMFFLGSAQLAVAQQLRIPRFFSDHMVLQRNSVVNIWGWANAGGQVVICPSWSADTIKVKVDMNGKWKAQVPTIAAGGPYTMDIKAVANVIKLKDILLGDVWLCSGQSNMAYSGNNGIKEILKELPQANDPNIRLLHVNRIASDYPQEDIGNTWSRLSAETLKPFSAIGYFIAKKIRKEENIPVGIISANWGGSPGEVWTPLSLLEKDSRLLADAKKVALGTGRPSLPSGAWNAMIYPLASFNMKGVFWYQGEANVERYTNYDILIKTMVSGWRSAWKDSFPFYFVQIAPYEYRNKEPKAAYLRDQQAKTALELPKAAMVVITDLVDNIKDIHPQQKKAVADRLAEIALVETYGKQRIDYKSPIYKSSVIKGNRIEIDFHFLDGALTVKGEDVECLYIAGKDKVFHKAKGIVKDNRLIVSSDKLKDPIAVRFGFSEAAIPNLFNKNGLPISPFRTDLWDSFNP